MTSSNLATFFMDPHQAGDMLYLHPETLHRRMREKPHSLPPYFSLGRKRLFFRQLTADWLNGDLNRDTDSGKKIQLNISSLKTSLDISDFASLLHFSPSTIYSMRSRPTSTSLPPCRDDIWVTRAVFDWILPQVQGIAPDSIAFASPEIPKVPTGVLLFHTPQMQSRSDGGRGR